MIYKNNVSCACCKHLRHGWWISVDGVTEQLTYRVSRQILTLRIAWLEKDSFVDDPRCLRGAYQCLSSPWRGLIPLAITCKIIVVIKH